MSVRKCVCMQPLFYVHSVRNSTFLGLKPLLTRVFQTVKEEPLNDWEEEDLIRSSCFNSGRLASPEGFRG